LSSRWEFDGLGSGMNLLLGFVMASPFAEGFGGTALGF